MTEKFNDFTAEVQKKLGDRIADILAAFLRTLGEAEKQPGDDAETLLILRKLGQMWNLNSDKPAFQSEGFYREIHPRLTNGLLYTQPGPVPEPAGDEKTPEKEPAEQTPPAPEPAEQKPEEPSGDEKTPEKKPAERMPEEPAGDEKTPEKEPTEQTPEEPAGDEKTPEKEPTERMPEEPTGDEKTPEKKPAEQTPEEPSGDEKTPEKEPAGQKPEEPSGDEKTPEKEPAEQTPPAPEPAEQTPEDKTDDASGNGPKLTPADDYYFFFFNPVIPHIQGNNVRVEREFSEGGIPRYTYRENTEDAPLIVDSNGVLSLTKIYEIMGWDRSEDRSKDSPHATISKKPERVSGLFPKKEEYTLYPVYRFLFKQLGDGQENYVPAGASEKQRILSEKKDGFTKSDAAKTLNDLRVWVNKMYGKDSGQSPVSSDSVGGDPISADI